jgi:hypothetical protein
MKDQIKANLAPKEPSPAPPAMASTEPEPRPQPAAPEPAAAAPVETKAPVIPSPAPPPADSGPALTGEALWQATQAEFSKKYALQSSYAAEMHFMSVDERHLILGAPADQRMAVMSLERPATRAALEEILIKFAGRRLLIKIEIREDLQSREIVLAPDPTDTAPPPAAAVEAPPPPPPTIDEAEFKKDPLIKEALRIFEAKITKKS